MVYVVVLLDKREKEVMILGVYAQLVHAEKRLKKQLKEFVDHDAIMLGRRDMKKCVEKGLYDDNYFYIYIFHESIL